MSNRSSNHVQSLGQGQLPIAGEVQSLLQLPGTEAKMVALTVDDEYCLARVDAQLQLDVGFGPWGTGYVQDAFSDEGSGFSGATGVALRDDRLLVIGALFDLETFRDHLALARYDREGNLDTTFGEQGKRVVELPQVRQRRFASRAQVAPGVRICRDPVTQDDGKIVVFFDEVSGDHFQGRATLIRLTAEGELDASFNGDGYVRVTYDGGEVYPKGVWVQADQKLLAFGGSHINADGTSTALIARFNPDGSLDESFHDGGFVALGTEGVTSLFSALLIDAQGRIVAIGNDDDKLLLTRRLADGQPDPDFNGGEPLLIDFEFEIESLPGLQLQGDSLVAAGTCRLPQSRSRRGLVLRLSADGRLDTGFGNGAGYRIHPQGSEYTSLLIEDDGQVVVAGYSYNPQFGACLERLGVNG